MRKILSCIAALFLLWTAECKAQRGHLSLAGDRTFRMKVDAQRDLRIKRHERRYTEALAARAYKRAKGSLDVVIVVRNEKKKDAKERLAKSKTQSQ